MSELVASLVALMLLVAVPLVLGRHLDLREQRWLWLATLAHALSAIVKVLLVYSWYGDGDMTSYVEYSQPIVDLVRREPERWLAPYMEMAINPRPRVPWLPPGDTGSTRAMYAFTVLHQLVFGLSRYGISLFVAVLSLSGKVAVYRVFRDHLPLALRDRIAWAVLLIPSAVFWSASLSKESLLWASFGWMVYGFHLTFFRGRIPGGLLLLLVGGFGASLFKAYVLFPFGIAAMVWLVSRSRILAAPGPDRPLRWMVGGLGMIAVAALLVVGLGTLFPRYQVQNFAEEAADLQSRGGRGSAEATYSLARGSGVRGQLQAVPMALVTAVYRPLITEARNPLMMVNALETTFFLLLTFYILYTRGLGALASIRRSPALLFCFTFVLLFAIAVGLTSTNLGTLSRYRMPMMPFFGVLMASLTPWRRPPS